MRTLRPHATALLAAALVTLFSWPVVGNMWPRLDLDGAWEIGLRMAAHDGLQFGPDLLFTYGPLGWLREPLLVFPMTARLAFAYGLLVHFALCATLIWALRRALGSLVLAALVAVLLAAAMWQEPTLVIGFTAAVAIAAGLARGRWEVVLALGLGLLTGIELLSKLNTGVTLGAFAIIAAPSPRRWPAAALAGALVVTVVAGWFAAGQSASAVGDYVTGSLGIVSGYSEAMAFEDPKAAWEFWVAFLVAGIGLVVAWRAGDLLPARGRWGLVALWGVLAFTSWKAGFIRHDPGHTNIYFVSLLGGLVAFGWAPHRRATAWRLGVLFTVVVFASLREDPANYYQPITRATKLFDQAQLLSDGSATNEAIATARQGRIPLLGIDPRLHEAMRDDNVHIEPAEAGVAWTLRVPWKPLPVFQTYSAYTHDLDERNAAAVRDPDGPQQILREIGINTIDTRNPAWESPEAQREMLCHFHAPLVAGRWVLLKRTAPRCGKPQPLKTVTAGLGQAAPIPPAPDASSVVFVRIDGVGVSGLERLRTAIYRALPRTAVLDGGRAFRLIPGTAEGSLVLRVPRKADFPAPFALDQGTNTLTINRALDRGDTVRLRFFSMPIR
jgi:hypothetical protein